VPFRHLEGRPVDDRFDNQLDDGSAAAVERFIQDGAAVIEIQRRREWVAGFRSFKIVLDDRVVGSVGTSAHTLCYVRPGWHTLMAKMDGIKTETLSIWLEQDDRAVFLVGVRPEVTRALDRTWSAFGAFLVLRRALPWWPPGSFFMLERIDDSGAELPEPLE
jgi:hypothetical protein